ncbi:MAG: DNA repair protein RecN [Propionibacteriaceae bacterium]|jgi:DNA repair protein RecN (Recombination protein N)|nr:DNA repair protein RecN [Propionibacteriaceae bacterium]
MLSELRIVDLGVIGEAVVEPSAGFTVVTGETGAGKTMIVTGLTLLSGEKADPKLIRAGAARALVEGRWALGADALAAAEEAGAEIDGGEVLITRQLAPSRSRMAVGGAQVPISKGAELVGEWVTIHGQAEQLRLGTPERQREVLDSWAWDELGPEMAKYQEVFARRKQAAAELRELTEHAQARARELDMLRFGLDEVAKVGPRPGEDAALAEESKRLQAVDELRLAARAALVALAGDDESYGDSDDALTLLGKARKSVQAAQSEDAALRPVGDQLADALAAANDAAASLASYLDALEADPVRLEWIAGRRAEFQALTRKYGSTIDEVLAWAEESSRRVLELDSSSERVDQLRAEVGELSAALDALADRITGIRQRAGVELATRAGSELAALAMPNARLEFRLTPLAEPGPHGRDQVQLLFRANPGSEPGPLGKVASGGELSRVRLALEVVLAAGGLTFVFDEVDAGVGGAVALEIGRRLKRLAEKAQVIVVTHLAQVAAFADKHFVVSKSDDGQVSISGVREVAGDERVETLARMMGGVDSASGVEHARDLLAQAAM